MKRFFLLTVMVAWSVAALGTNSTVPKVAPMPEKTPWCLQPTVQGTLQFHGLQETDAAREGPDSMLYVGAAPGVVGAIASLAAGVATHGAIVSSAKARHATERAQEADQVLAPYRPMLEQFTTERLVTALLALRTDVAVCLEPVASGIWRVQLNPVFLLSQSQTSVIADIVVWAAPAMRTQKELPRATSVRVVSSSLNEREFADQWMVNDGFQLGQHAAILVSRALDVAMRWEIQEAAPPTAIPWATYRFTIGDRQHMERAQWVDGNCRSGVLRTLRATYVVASMDQADCAEPSDSPIVPAVAPTSTE